MRTSTAPALLVTLLLLAGPGPAAGGEDAVTTWDRILINGARSGHARTARRVLPEEGDAIETVMASEIDMNRLGQTISIRTSSVTRETADGNLLEITSRTLMSAQEATTVFTFADGTLTISTEVMGQTRTVQRPVPSHLDGPVAMAEASRRLAGTTGATFTFTTFLADYQAVVHGTLTSRGVEPVERADGTRGEATRIESELRQADGTPLPLSPVTWMDAAGEPIRTLVEVGGMRIETVRVASEAAAKGPGAAGPGDAPDLFLGTLLGEPDPIPVPRRLEAAWIVVGTRRAGAPVPDLADEGHHVTPREEGTVLVHSVRRVPPADARGVRPLAEVPDDLVDALAPSSMIQSDADEILAIAEDVVGEETCAWAAAQRLERWVEAHITKKDMGTAFGSALEACRSGEGDCTEHAVLLAALCRAAGIPARVVMGLEYLAGIWGGHAWNEVWIEGSWYPLDATNGLGFVDPLHLPLAHMVMKEGGASEFTQLLAGLGNLTVDITEVQRDGRRIVVGDPALVELQDGAYRNAVLGVAFAAPPGFELDPPQRGPGPSSRVMEVLGTTAEGARVEIGIDVTDAPAAEGWDALLARRHAGEAGSTALEVDGRAARALTRSRNGRTERRVFVVVDGALWLFTLDLAGGATQDAAFDTFLQSIDFDVR